MRARQQPTQVRPASSVLDEQRQMATIREIYLRPVDRTQAQATSRNGELHRARDRVVIGQRECVVAELQRRWNELVRKRRAVQKREGRMTMKLHVHGRTYVR